ncbi:hypothetical protein DRN75_02015 [Nanoarchaeota archaeon]|nr:MAG: hypothetical protein DRN75_02015 [Nanoarchaeota archaeon]
MIISLGGSVITKNGLNVKFLKSIRKLLPKKYVIVCGGGTTAREYIKAGSLLGLSKNKLDELGIEATILNAKLVSYALGARFVQGNPSVTGKLRGKIVTGGYKPGHTTDYDAVLAAISSRDIIINVSDVKGVYTRDPKKYKNAKLIRKMTYDDYLNMFKGYKPGEHIPFDVSAMQLAKKYNIKIIFVDETNFKHLLNNKAFIGTTIASKHETH